MSIEQISPALRTKDVFHHIDMGFLNRRLCLTALFPDVRQAFFERSKPDNDHLSRLQNDHLLVTRLLDCCEAAGVPTLLEALAREEPTLLFKSTEKVRGDRLVYKPNVRITQSIDVPIDFGLPVELSYGTEHLVSSTGTMTLAEGSEEGYVHSIVGLLHRHPDKYRIEPLVIGAPWFDHPRNGDDCLDLMWLGKEFGELLPEDINQFSKMSEISLASADEWMSVMSNVSEAYVKESFAALLAEPTKKRLGW